MADPAAYGRQDAITRIDTHGAIVFLAGPDVYKVKRAVRFSFMDFSTLQKRHAACDAEMVVNRENAPGLYLGVVPITRGSLGLRLGGDGPVVEWAVHLRRFDEATTFEHLAAEGPLGPGLMDALAQAVVAAHRRASVRDGMAATEALGGVVRDTANDIAAATDIFPSDMAAAFGEALRAAFDRAQPLLQRRGMQGQVRRCHGDLHLGNVALIDGHPVLFDALEFDEAIATCDVLYDLAFLLMDLMKFGRKADADILLDRYLAYADDRALQIAGLATLPLFLGLRAAVRAKVVGALSRLEASKPGLKATAQTYLVAAAMHLNSGPPPSE